MRQTEWSGSLSAGSGTAQGAALKQRLPPEQRFQAGCEEILRLQTACVALIAPPLLLLRADSTARPAVQVLTGFLWGTTGFA